MSLIARIARQRVSSRSRWAPSTPARSLSDGSGIVDTAVEHYKSDTQTLARWLDVSVVKKKGRAFDADTELIPAKGAKIFPLIKGYSLNSKDVRVPDSIVQDALLLTDAAKKDNSNGGASGVRFVAFSFKHYGFTLVRSWLTPFLEKFGQGPKAQIPAIEICFVEYGFLSLTKNIFATNLKTQILPSQHDLTALSFGGVMDFAAALQLPNKYTGYVYLIDAKNRVRWRGCGQCNGADELERLYRIADSLLLEEGGANSVIGTQFDAKGKAKPKYR